MIEQLAIAATPRYNFPKLTMEASLPKHLLNLSMRSLGQAQEQALQLNDQLIGQEFNPTRQLHTDPVTLNSLPLTPRTEKTMIAAIDTASMKLGETRKGVLFTVRGAAIWKHGREHRYLKLGPLIFHITEENTHTVFCSIEEERYDHPHEIKCPPTSFLQMPTRIAGFFERWLQNMLSKTITDGMILFDGSLGSGVADNSCQHLRRTLLDARRQRNVVLAFSKMTTLRLSGYLITDLASKHEPPSLLEISGLRPTPPIVLLGDVYAAKLGRGYSAYRLDIDREVPSEQRLEAVEKLLGNDSLFHGYPETLRLAHILCTFTANEVLAMRHFLRSKCSLKIVERPDMHRLLFGPFGKGETFA